MTSQQEQGSAVTPLITLRASVRGRVQGVGFRLFVRDRAQRLGLAGYVRNQADGSVYVTAAGDRAMLEELLAHLWRGPLGARVAAVEHQWVEGHPDADGGGFEVRR